MHVVVVCGVVRHKQKIALADSQKFPENRPERFQNMSMWAIIITKLIDLCSTADNSRF
jgi:DeoR/GlpR family transcriptional regulator of sugar metabolism